MTNPKELKKLNSGVPRARSGARHALEARHGTRRPRSWNGHQPATQLALENILLRASVDPKDLGLPERVLVNACELRSGMEAGSWGIRMRENRSAELRVTAFILNELGAPDLSDYVAQIIRKLDAALPPQRERALLRYLERRLIAEGARLDAQIAEYVVKLPKSARS